MNAKKYLFYTLLFGAALALLPRAFPKSALANPTTSSTPFDAIDAFIEEQMRRLKLSGASLAIVEGDQIVHMRSFGQARPGGGAPTPQTPFFIGSTTKSLTALAVMQLVEAGKVELDAPLQRYLPWFRVADPQASAQMTVRHLLNQSSGLPLGPAWELLADFDDQPGALERQARALSTVKLSHPVGSAFGYSNLNYNLLGLVVEAASGASYTDYVQRQIFEPLEMSHSHTSKAAAKQDGLAVGHQTWFGFPVAAPDLPVPAGSLPSGQLISSAEDMGHYLIALLNQGQYKETQILSPAGVAELHQPGVEAMIGGSAKGHYGMGWYIEQREGMTFIHHTGMCPDFYAYMALLPEQKKGVVLLVNTNHFVGEFTSTEVGDGVSALLAGRQPAPIEYGMIPWVLRGLLLVPLLQIAGVVATLLMLGRWRRDPGRRPSRRRMWGTYILPSVVLNLIPIASGIALLSSNLRGFLMLFAPDLSWLALISGGFALVWSLLRTVLMLKVVK